MAILQVHSEETAGPSLAPPRLFYLASSKRLFEDNIAPILSSRQLDAHISPHYITLQDTDSRWVSSQADLASSTLDRTISQIIQLGLRTQCPFVSELVQAVYMAGTIGCCHCFRQRITISPFLATYAIEKPADL